MSATDRVDGAIESSLVRAPSHQPYGGDGEGELERLKSVRSHVSHHAHFAPEPEIAEDTRPPSPPPPPAFDIEHVPVDDDPRQWSNRKKNLVMALMTTAVVSSNMWCRLRRHGTDGLSRGHRDMARVTASKASAN